METIFMNTENNKKMNHMNLLYLVTKIRLKKFR